MKDVSVVREIVWCFWYQLCHIDLVEVWRIHLLGLDVEDASGSVNGQVLFQEAKAEVAKD